MPLLMLLLLQVSDVQNNAATVSLNAVASSLTHIATTTATTALIPFVIATFTLPIPQVVQLLLFLKALSPVLFFLAVAAVCSSLLQLLLY